MVVPTIAAEPPRIREAHAELRCNGEDAVPISQVESDVTAWKWPSERGGRFPVEQADRNLCDSVDSEKQADHEACFRVAEVELFLI